MDNGEQEDLDAPKSTANIEPMKRGDYQIHVCVEQAKKMKIEAGDKVDPIV